MTPDQVGELLNVSRETIKKFQAYLTLLEKWQRRINLVSNSTLTEAWQRHILDSGQLAAHYPPQTKHILDVGSGAGFPGLVLAIMGGVTVDLVESDQRKAVFLSTVIRELGLPAKVHNQRIETMPNLRPDVITARALASVPKLLNLIEIQLHPDCACLFLKGASVEDELTNLQSYSTMVATTYPSLSGSTGVVLELKNPR
ncbi:16S rRNA (guanine(527)-N(7))-methyltransferase RsmG [Alphaproteobacteria bacterium]|nr:16S rRNA (guanine(527)-N(7))-methyltransferase RsmG [Alphaproteobacteria bacterium]MDB2638553.1 16S rRNA (guanine(527)-N(7))-methyltransferase RsmG [Alphaproteobacteria bacterium]MDC3370353.1 16S rRNA (guanine(527)-N(7))-methyltransferase RsmG [Alphaproteobacteria bacterium]